MFNDLGTDFGPRLVLAAVAVGIGLMLLVGILLILKRRNSSLFVRGGKSRDPRLMIVDATAVDAKRRLVLVRRDNIEHLIMIGGPTDIVIERGILAPSNAEARSKGDRTHIPLAVDSPTSERPTTLPRQPVISQHTARAHPAPELSTLLALEAKPLADRKIQTQHQPPALSSQSAPLQSNSLVEPDQRTVSNAPPDPAKGSSPSALSAAQDALEAARQRVLQPKPVLLSTPAPKTIDNPIAAQPAPGPTKASPRPDPLATEFEHILEAEMVANGISLEAASKKEPDRAPWEVRPVVPVNTPPEQPAAMQTVQADDALETEMIRLMGQINADRKN